jgi:hypothetical protein
LKKLTVAPRSLISRKAISPAYRTSVPAAARKFQSKVSGYSEDVEAIGFSRKINETGLPPAIS